MHEPFGSWKRPRSPPPHVFSIIYKAYTSDSCHGPPNAIITAFRRYFRESRIGGKKHE